MNVIEMDSIAIGGLVRGKIKTIHIKNAHHVRKL